MKLVLGYGKCTESMVYNTSCYKSWTRLLERHRDKRHVLCEEFMDFSAYRLWYEDNYVKGCVLCHNIYDINENHVSPATAKFVPRQIMMAIRKKRESFKGHSYRKVQNRYCVNVSMYGKGKHCGTFDNRKEAIDAYEFYRHKYLSELFDKYSKEFPFLLELDITKLI